jgi:hypothetical protein
VEKSVKSIKLGPSVASCTLYGLKGCGADRGVLVIDRDIEVERYSDGGEFEMCAGCG